jgi:hypothetical protein
MVTRKTSGFLGGGAAMLRVAVRKQISNTPGTFTENQTSTIIAVIRASGAFRDEMRIADLNTLIRFSPDA